MRFCQLAAPLSACLLLGLPVLSHSQPSSSDLQDPVPSGPQLQHKLTLGAFFSAGDYGGEDDTSIRYLPLSYEVARFPWILSLTVPYLTLEGPGDVFLEAGSVAGSTAPSIDSKGLGDLLLSGTWQLDPLPGNLFVDLGLQLKLPTADAGRGLGTGESDLSLQVDLYRSFGGLTGFATLGYRQRGRTPLYDLRDSAFGSLGVLRPWGSNGRLGLLYDYRDAASSHSHESHELMPFYAWEPGGG